jgi:hypothetical protein
MSSQTTKTKAETLLLKAAEDEVLLDWAGTPDAIFGFHAQQAAEKLMKALLAHLGIQFELTHNLTRLAKSIAKVDQPLPDLGLPLRKLTRFGVVYRYEFQPLTANPTGLSHGRPSSFCEFILRLGSQHFQPHLNSSATSWP